uniref:Uncharacterized protein n=1 Tax=Schistocephalus solidus TaxID=70667 RepID=A0A0X3Q4F3_SCHSO
MPGNSSPTIAYTCLFFLGNKFSLRELLESANEKVNTLKYVQEENENLLRENGELESLVKNLQSQASKSASYERLNSQYQQVRAALETAEHTILEFVKERESARAASEAEARVLSTAALRRLCGGTPTSQNHCTCTCHHSTSVETGKPEPPSLTEIGSPPVDTIMEVSICRDAHLGSELDISYSGGEVMSDVLAADKCIQELESKTAELSDIKASLLSAQSEIVELRKEAKRERLKSLFHRALESHRRSILEVKIKAKDEVLSGLENDMESVHNILQSKERELAAAMVRVENLENDLASAKEEGDGKAARWSEQRRQLTEEIQRCRQQLQAREANLTGQLQQAKAQHQTEISELQFQVEQLKDQIADLSHEHNKQLSSINNKLSSERANFDNQVASLCCEKEALVHELQEATVALSTARDETLRLDTQAKELQAELVHARGQVTSLSDRLTVSADNVTRLEAELAVCKKRLAEAVAQNGEDSAALSNARASCINNLRVSLMSAEQREAEARHEASMARFLCDTTEKENARLLGRITALESRLDTEAVERLNLEDRLAKEAVRWRQLQGACQEQEALIASLKHQVETLMAQKQAAEEAHRLSMLRHLQSFYAQQEAEERVAMLECSRKQSAYSLEHLHKYSTSLTDSKSRSRNDHTSVPALGHPEPLNLTANATANISDLHGGSGVGSGVVAPPVLRTSSTPSALAPARQSPMPVVFTDDGDNANTTESEDFAPITELIEPQTEEQHTPASLVLPLEQFCNSPLFNGDCAQFNRLSPRSPICPSSQVGSGRLESPSPTSISSAIYSETFESSLNSVTHSPNQVSLVYAGSSIPCTPVSVGTVSSISPCPEEVCLTANYVTYKNLSVADYAASAQIHRSEQLRSSPLISADSSPVPSVHAFPYADCTAAVSPQKDHRINLPVADALQMRRIQRLLLLPSADEDPSYTVSLETKTLPPEATALPCIPSPGAQREYNTDPTTAVSVLEKAQIPSAPNYQKVLPTSQGAVDSPNNLTTQVTAQSFGPLQYRTLPVHSSHRPVPDLTIEQMKAYQVTINKSSADMSCFKRTDSSLSLSSIPTTQIRLSPPKLARFHSAFELTLASADSVSLVSAAESAKISRATSHHHHHRDVASGTLGFRRLKERFKRSRHSKSKHSRPASFTASGPESPSALISTAAYPPPTPTGDGPVPLEEDHNGSLVSGKSVKSQNKFHLPIIFGKKSAKASKKETTKPTSG